MSGSNDCTTKLWDLDSGACLHTLNAEAGVDAVSACAIDARTCVVYAVYSEGGLCECACYMHILHTMSVLLFPVTRTTIPHNNMVILTSMIVRLSVLFVSAWCAGVLRASHEFGSFRVQRRRIVWYVCGCIDGSYA